MRALPSTCSGERAISSRSATALSHASTACSVRGVALADKTTQIDLELGADDFAGAFDAWRLARYAEARKTEEFLKFTDARHVEAALQELLARGAI